MRFECTLASRALVQGSVVLQRFMQLIVQYGNVKNNHWLNALSAAMTVDAPIKHNQALVLNMIHQHEEHILYLFETRERRKECVRMLLSVHASGERTDASEVLFFPAQRCLH